MIFYMILYALMAACILAMAAQIYQWTKEHGWKTSFRDAFKEWSDANDWQGYDEIPITMYDDLVSRIKEAK